VGHHDIDLVARKGSLVVFVEVRYRRSKRFGTPTETIGPEKKRDLARGAEAWLQRFGRPGDSVRFDVIGVLGQRVEWVQSAFRPGWR
jgi:putative endonuclease